MHTDEFEYQYLQRFFCEYCDRPKYHHIYNHCCNCHSHPEEWNNKTWNNESLIEKWIILDIARFHLLNNRNFYDKLSDKNKKLLIETALKEEYNQHCGTLLYSTVYDELTDVQKSKAFNLVLEQRGGSYLIREHFDKLTPFQVERALSNHKLHSNNRNRDWLYDNENLTYKQRLKSIEKYGIWDILIGDGSFNIMHFIVVLLAGLLFVFVHHTIYNV